MKSFMKTMHALDLLIAAGYGNISQAKFDSPYCPICHDEEDCTHKQEFRELSRR